MKKTVGWILILILSLTIFPAYQAEANTATAGHYTVKVDNVLNIREQPTPKAKVVGSLKNGTVVYVYETVPGGWSKIKYKNKAAYVASQYLKNKAGKSPAKATPVIMRDIKFNMTKQQIIAKETRQKIAESPDYLAYVAKKYDYNALLIYAFTNNRLDFVIYDFNPDRQFYTYEELEAAYSLLNRQAAREFGYDFYKSYDEGIDYEEYSSFWMESSYAVLLHVHNLEGVDNISLAYGPSGTFSASSESTKDRRIKQMLEEIEIHKAAIKQP